MDEDEFDYDDDLTEEEQGFASSLAPQLQDPTVVAARLVTRIQNTGSGVLATKRPILTNLCAEYFQSWNHSTGMGALHSQLSVHLRPRLNALLSRFQSDKNLLSSICK